MRRGGPSVRLHRRTITTVHPVWPNVMTWIAGSVTGRSRGRRHAGLEARPACRAARCRWVLPGSAACRSLALLIGLADRRRRRCGRRLVARPLARRRVDAASARRDRRRPPRAPARRGPAATPRNASTPRTPSTADRSTRSNGGPPSSSTSSSACTAPMPPGTQNESKVLSALSPVAADPRRDAREDRRARAVPQRAVRRAVAQLRSAAESEERLRATAETLASALSSNSTRGVWGETQLRNVVEAAGLLERVDFDVQSSVTTSVGAARPDMVVHLPGGKTIAVDAKVPFSAYLQAAEIPATATGAEGPDATSSCPARQGAPGARRRPRRAGVLDRATTPPPSSPSRSSRPSPSSQRPRRRPRAARPRLPQADRPRLPVTLWSVLKTVAFSWQQDVVTHEARELFQVSRELYGRLSDDGRARRQARPLDPGLGRRLQPVRGVARTAGAAECPSAVAARRVEGHRGPLRRSRTSRGCSPRPELVGALDED